MNRRKIMLTGIIQLVNQGLIPALTLPEIY